MVNSLSNGCLVGGQPSAPAVETGTQQPHAVRLFNHGRGRLGDTVILKKTRPPKPADGTTTGDEREQKAQEGLQIQADREADYQQREHGTSSR